MNKKEYVMKEIHRIGDSLDLDSSIRQFAWLMSLTCDVADVGRGRSADEMVGGCLFLAVRELQVPIQVSEIGELSQARTKDILRTYMDIMDGLNIHLQPSQPKKFVAKYVFELNEKYESRLPDGTVDLAKEIIEFSDAQGMESGSTPMGVAAGAVYVATEIKNRRVSQQEVADVAGVTPETVRENARAHRTRIEEDDWI